MFYRSRSTSPSPSWLLFSYRHLLSSTTWPDRYWEGWYGYLPPFRTLASLPVFIIEVLVHRASLQSVLPRTIYGSAHFALPQPALRFLLVLLRVSRVRRVLGEAREGGREEGEEEEQRGEERHVGARSGARCLASPPHAPPFYTRDRTRISAPGHGKGPAQSGRRPARERPPPETRPRVREKQTATLRDARDWRTARLPPAEWLSVMHAGRSVAVIRCRGRVCAPPERPRRHT